MVTIESGKLGELFKIKQNKMPIKNNEMVVFLGMEDVSEDGKIVNQHVLPFSEIKKGLTYFEKNDILVAKITPCFENGKGAFLDTLKTEKGFGSTEFHVLRAKTNVDPRYIFYHTQTEKFRKKLESEMTGTAGQKRVPISAVINYPLSIVHSRTEQQAIASALSDVDALITALEQLITKKRNIKQGAMQQLLTGKKRLPGFSGEWEVKKLGEILDYEQPTKYIVKDTEYDDNNDTPVLTAGKTLILGYTNEETGIFINLPVIIFDDFTTANKYVTYPFKIKSSALKILKPKNENINLRFVFEKMQLIIFHLGDHKRYWISEYQNLGIELPLLPEQQAIAAILSDMDAEIEALEQKRVKHRALKQGMMQELLTGKTRLIKENKA